VIFRKDTDMLGTMPHEPLQLRRILEYGATVHGTARVATATPAGAEAATFAAIGNNAARLAAALAELGVGPGGRVATMMWNNQQHVETYLAVPSMGAVLHPLNFRLADAHIAHAANHASDQVVIVDADLVGTLTRVLPHLRTVEHVIINGARPAEEDVKRYDSVTWHEYDTLIAGRPPVFPWPDVDEDCAAAMCYTSGTTGAPKGVVYTHRSVYLHAMAVCMPGNFGLSAADRMLAVVPQFHVLAWGLPYASFLSGAELAMPGRYLGAPELVDFISAVRPTKAAGVPTVWQSVLDMIGTDSSLRACLSSLKEIVVGGSACPPVLMEAYDRLMGITMVHAWGMTETSPLGAVARPPVGADPALAWRYRYTQGRFPAEVQARLIGADGSVRPHDGTSIGELEVRGPWVTAAYHGGDGAEKFHDGWLRTGDVGAITENGYLVLTDRLKDVIKSGGEWISSVELENHLMAHAGVREAAVIAVADRKWGERPLAVVVPRDTTVPSSAADLRGFLAERVPKWQLPDQWAALDELPRTSVGKIDKNALRQWYVAGALTTLSGV
jgi:fatty-acyl-CoA synthase